MTAPPATRSAWHPRLPLKLSANTVTVAARKRPRKPPQGAPRPRRRWPRRLVTVVATASSLMLIALGAISWYFAHRLVQVTPVPDAYPLRVIAIDATAASVTLSRGPDADEPGSFRLSWRTGHATTGPVVAEAAKTVTRSLVGISGRLDVGQRVGIQANPLTGSPWSALGLPFEDVTVAGPTGALPAWYIAGRRHTWVLLIHGLDGSRSDTLPAMATLRALGFPMLAISYRNDAGAAPSRDNHSQLGDTEWHDVDAAISYATSHSAQGVVLYGWSLGAGMAVVASELSPRREIVRALVLDSPLLDWPATLQFNASRHGMPAVVTWATRAMLAVGSGVHLNRYHERRLATALAAPTLLVQGSADSVVPAAVADQFARTRPELITYLRVAGADHVSAADADPSGYAAALGQLLGPLP